MTKPTCETESWPGELRALRGTIRVLLVAARHASDEHLRTKLMQELAEYAETEQSALAAAPATEAGEGQ